MLRTAAVVVALAAPPVATLHAGQTRWFAPGALNSGDRVACVTSAGPLVLTVPKPTPRATVAKTAWKKTVQASVEVHPDGAAEVDCATSSPPLVRRVPPYVVGPHGLGLIRGTNTLARVERRFGAGRPSSRAGACSVTWRALGLGATFASCRPTAALVRARVTGARWSSLDGVRIGDGVARMRWQDGHARRLGPHRWLLGGVGAKGPPRLVAVLRRGAVVAFEIDVRP